MSMFNYLFPIFCFGLVITGIVYLGLLEAANQAVAASLKEGERDTPISDKTHAPLVVPRS